MYHPESVMVLGVVATVATIGIVARSVINAVAQNLLRIKASSAGAPPAVPAGQEQRMAQMEAEIASLREEVSRLSAVETFYAQLQAPASASRPIKASGGT